MTHWEFKTLPESAKGRDLISRLLLLRGLEDQEIIEDFLQPEFKALFSPLYFKQMGLAVERILLAREKGEKLAIVGDYDADGITATALLVRLAAFLALDPPLVILPHRLHDGYGLSPAIIERIEKAGASLIITVDNGITGHEAACLAAEAGIDLIITDHHAPTEELPRALAIINPWVEGETYPFRELAGVGLAYKLAAAVLARTHSRGEAERFLKWAFDLVAIGTIADVVPLLGENRIFTKLGLTVIPLSKSTGLKALLKLCKLDSNLDATDVAFRIAPRLNAAGRLADPNLALDLLLETDEERAGLLARELERINSERQAIVSGAIVLAREEAEAALKSEDKLIIVRNSSWQPGITGLIAGRLCEEHRLPVIAMTNLQDEGVWVASVRSLPGFSVKDFIAEHSRFFLRSGGHSEAGGFSLAAENLVVFEETARSWARQNSTLDSAQGVLEIDSLLQGHECNFETTRAILALSPFGAGNPEPVLALEDVRVEASQKMGSDGRHRRLRLELSNGSFLTGVAFGVSPDEPLIEPGERISLAGHLRINYFRDQEYLQFFILDIKKNPVTLQ